MPTLRFEVHDAAGPQPIYWRVKDGDDILARSETMYNKADAIDIANKVKRQTYLYRFEVTDWRSATHPFSWHAVAANGRIVIASTNIYKTRAAADAAMRYVMTYAASAEVVDMTVTARR